MSTCATNEQKCALWRLRVEGPCLDAVRVERLRDELRKAISTGANAIVIDLEHVERLDHLGLAGLAQLKDDAGPCARIALASLQPQVQEAALLVHLHEILDIYEDANAATRDLILKP